MRFLSLFPVSFLMLSGVMGTASSQELRGFAASDFGKVVLSSEQAPIEWPSDECWKLQNRTGGPIRPRFIDWGTR